MSTLRLLPEVLDDAARAARWYDEQGGIDLGERFLATFYAYLPLIQNEGGVFRPVYHDFRRVMLRPFPYAVYYRFHEETAVIALLIHGARNPRLVRDLLSRRIRY